MGSRGATSATVGGSWRRGLRQASGFLPAWTPPEDEAELLKMAEASIRAGDKLEDLGEQMAKAKREYRVADEERIRTAYLKQLTYSGRLSDRMNEALDSFTRGKIDAESKRIRAGLYERARANVKRRVT